MTRLPLLLAIFSWIIYTLASHGNSRTMSPVKASGPSPVSGRSMPTIEDRYFTRVFGHAPDLDAEAFSWDRFHEDYFPENVVRVVILVQARSPDESKERATIEDLKETYLAFAFKEAGPGRQRYVVSTTYPIQLESGRMVADYGEVRTFETLDQLLQKVDVTWYSRFMNIPLGDYEGHDQERSIYSQTYKTDIQEWILDMSKCLDPKSSPLPPFNTSLNHFRADDMISETCYI